MRLTRRTSWFWPLLVGGLSVALTAWTWQHERDSQQRDLRSRFDAALRQTSSRIEQRMASYEQMLRGLRGLFDASDEVTPADFDTYVDLLQAGADFAGLRALGHARLQPDGTGKTRGSGAPDSPGGRAPTRFLAPATGQGLSPPGEDLLADPRRRAAMLQAGDSGNVVATPMLQPAGTAGAGRAEAGFLMFMPLYAKGQPLGSVAERRAALAGWVFASFRVGDLVSSLYGEGTPGLDLHIHDGASTDEASRIYPPSPAAGLAGPTRFDAQEYIGFAGHTWTLWARSTPAFEPLHGKDAAQVIAIAGLGLSGALTLLTWLLVTGRDRAHDTAREMTQQLRESEQRYRRIVETASEGIWVVDAEGRTTFVNPALQQLLDRPAAALLGQPWTAFMDEAGRQAVARGDLVQRPHGPGTAREVRFLKRDGSALWASLSTSPIIDELGRPAGLLAMVTDVSERHQAEARREQLEDRLRQAQKMEAIGTLAGGIAHDFNNILAAILGNVALVRQDLGEAHPALARLDQIGRAGLRARSLVQQIGAFSRQQAQRLEAQPLAPLLEEAAALVRATLPEGVALVLELAPEPLVVAADATQLQQVLMNLCTNAWHALPEHGGRIVVGLAAATLDGATAERLGLAPGLCAQVWVSDNGCGMDEATRHRIFEPFFTTKPVDRGTGLGLSVVHGIVTAHRGAIAVHSTPGDGSRFDLYLPLARAAALPPLPASVPEAASPAVPRGSGQHVLYVDDDEVMTLMVGALLQRLGYRVSCEQDPRRALARAASIEDPVDVVVTDHNMPGMSGLDLARALAVTRPALPVLVSSGHVPDSLRNEALHAGVRQVLQKEFTLEQLGLALHQVLGNDAVPAPA